MWMSELGSGVKVRCRSEKRTPQRAVRARKTCECERQGDDDEDDNESNDCVL